MLEMKMLSDEEESKYRDYEGNILFHYGMKILILQDALETLGENEYLSDEMTVQKKKCGERLFNRFRREDRQEMLSLIKKYPNLNREQLAKRVFMESEFSWV